jgi:hypothetical protein
MTIWKDRITGRNHPGPTSSSIPGRWALNANGGNALINNQSLLDGNACFLVPDRRQNWSIIQDVGSIKETGHFDTSVLPDAADMRALSQIAAAIDHSKTLAEYIAVSPLPTDLDDRTKSQAIDQQIRNRYIHLVHACRRPRQQLKTDLEKLPVGRAKRIPPRSLEYLASHSEDWKRKTVNGIEPTHVIAEIVEDQLNIYENRVTAELLDRIAIYLNQRVSELEKIKSLLDDRSNFQSAFSQNATFRLADRISSLWGAIFKDSSLSRATHDLRDQLASVKRSVVGLKQSILYRSIPRKREIKQEIHHTNIFDNDPHYREIAELWRAWHESRESKEQDEEAIFSSWQKANQDFSSFCRLLVCRSLHDIGWKLKPADFEPSVASLSFMGPDGSEVLLDEQVGMTYSITTAEGRLNIVPLLATLGRVADDGQLADWLIELEAGVDAVDTLFLYYGKSSELRNLSHVNSKIGMLLDGFSRQKNAHGKRVLFVPVSPFEITSLEKTGRHLNMLLRGQLLRSFPPKIKAPEPLARYIGLDKGGRQHESRSDHWSHMEPISAAEVARIESLVVKLSLPEERRKVRDISDNAKATMLENVRSAERLSSGVLTCPVCGQSQARFQSQGGPAYSCTCKSCEAEWGLRMCRNCHQPYPYLNSANTTASTELVIEPGWLDRLQGRDSIAVPCASQNDSWAFVCSNCLACPSKPDKNKCAGCPAFANHSAKVSETFRH